jgi:hypothetical protein
MGITDVGDNSSSILKVGALYSKRQPTPKLWMIFCSGLTRLRLIADETKSVTRFDRWSVSVTATMLQQLWFSVDFGIRIRSFICHVLPFSWLRRTSRMRLSSMKARNKKGR